MGASLSLACEAFVPRLRNEADPCICLKLAPLRVDVETPSKAPIGQGLAAKIASGIGGRRFRQPKGNSMKLPRPQEKRPHQLRGRFPLAYLQELRSLLGREKVKRSGSTDGCRQCWVLSCGKRCESVPSWLFSDLPRG